MFPLVSLRPVNYSCQLISYCVLRLDPYPPRHSRLPGRESIRYRALLFLNEHQLI